MKTKSIVLITLLLISMRGWLFGQRPTDCQPFNQQLARQHIKAGMPKLFLAGGIAPILRASDASTEKQFGFVYQDLGCVRPANPECLQAYSQVVFAYLNAKYGNTWRTHVRKEVLFLPR